MNPLAYMVLALLLFLTACASSQGLPLASLQQTLQDEEARFVGALSSESTAKSSTRQDPPKLGLYVMPTGFLRHEFEWTDADREALLAWTNGLQRDGLIAGASFIQISSIKGNQLAQLRESAARYGADLLLIVDGAATVDRYNNYKGPLLYWTILGAFFADGTQSDALCLVRGALWDVRGETKLFGEEAQGLSKIVGPAARVEDQEGVTAARRQALTQLMEKLRDDFARTGSGR
jgi:rhombotail lipoprotein